MRNRDYQLYNFIEYINSEINKESHNAHVYYRGESITWEDWEVSFERNHIENYKKVVVFAANNNGIIINTDPLTYSVKIRFTGCKKVTFPCDTCDKAKCAGCI